MQTLVGITSSQLQQRDSQVAAEFNQDKQGREGSKAAVCLELASSTRGQQRGVNKNHTKKIIGSSCQSSLVRPRYIAASIVCVGRAVPSAASYDTTQHGEETAHDGASCAAPRDNQKVTDKRPLPPMPTPTQDTQ